MLRSFILEGYLISTGSMAPGLLGFHRRINCPSCQYSFAFGVSFDDSVGDGDGVIHEPEGTRRYATCPNCGQINIDVSGVPNSHGDQLLVQKHVYDLRAPHRWETIVFLNQAAPGEAYVKRVVGLPGDRIRIMNGDVYINGAIARKSFLQQQWMRIPVCDLHHLVDSDDWQLPWELDDQWQAKNGALRLAGQQVGGGETKLQNADNPELESRRVVSAVRWIRFRNWRWSGGHHVSETPLPAADGLADWQNFVSRFDVLPVTWVSQLEYDKEREVLRCEGVMSDDLQAEILREAGTDALRKAVYRLAALSHLAPVTDRYGYNAMVSSPEYVVSDLMIRAAMSWATPPAAIQVQVPVESRTYRVIVKPEEGIVQLASVDDQKIVRSGSYEKSRIAGSNAGEELILEVSNMDRQVIVAVNGKQCLEALEVDSEIDPEQTLEASVTEVDGKKMDHQRAAQIALRLEQQKRWALGVSGDDVRIRDLEMYRDVFYTPGRRKNAVDQDFIVPAESYFVQGDNSPVSSDSRNWALPCVPHRLLIGKPFLVHLPSRPAVLQFGGRQWPIRIPEWSRIRYIR